jgi:hypothetical protein
MKKLLKSERGSAIVTAIALMTVMIGVGLAAFALADDQQAQTSKERVRESSFNLAEGLLDTQSYILSRGWPSSLGATLYQDCTQAAASTQFCPQPAQLASSFDQKDYTNNDVTWTTTVRDDTGSQFYDYTAVNARPHYDANGNNRVWVRAQTTIKRQGATSCTGSATPVRCRSRAVVALLEIEQFQETMPRRVIIAGSFELTPNGNHNYVNTNPDATSRHDVTVRCKPPATPDQQDPCLGFTPDRQRPQINPEGAYEQGFVNQDALPDDQKARLKERAIADGTYYTGCPTEAQLAGKVVWVAGCPDGHYTKGSTWNSLANPGLLIWEDGLLELGGNSTFWGIVYHLNNSNSTDNVLQLHGGLTIEGGAFVDGPGGILVGSNKVNINFQGNAFDLVATFGTAAVVQNSWREVAVINP